MLTYPTCSGIVKEQPDTRGLQYASSFYKCLSIKQAKVL